MISTFSILERIVLVETYSILLPVLSIGKSFSIPERIVLVETQFKAQQFIDAINFQYPRTDRIG